MVESFRLDLEGCRAHLIRRFAEPAPGRIQLLTGPRQVGKTTLLLDLAQQQPSGLYVACDDPRAGLPGFWEQTWHEAEARAARAPSTLFLDEIQHVADWTRKLKSQWDRLRRHRIPLHVVATGSSALQMVTGSRETLAGRFERLTLGHWSAATLAHAFSLDAYEAADAFVKWGSYPGAFPLRSEPARWQAYVRDAIIEPAVGRDLLALGAIRRPALLRQVFAVAATLPARIVSLQKMQGALRDRGALETIAHYLTLLEEAFLVAALPKFAATEMRARAAPPKLVVLNNALVSALDGAGPPSVDQDPERFGRWLENACLASAWNAGQRLQYWREEPLEVDAVLEGSWGRWAIEITVGRVDEHALRGLLEFTRRHPAFRPVVVTQPGTDVHVPGVRVVDWPTFLTRGLLEPV